MLTVSNRGFCRTISAQRIRNVTEAAAEVDSDSDSDSARDADPMHMGPLDWFTDHVLCGGVKTAVLTEFDEIGRKAALLRRELQKNEAEKNRPLIEQYQAQIQRAATRLNQFISGKTVVIDSDFLRAPGGSGFLIIREKNSRLPTGIALCRGATPAPALPAPDNLFHCATPESIHLTDLVKIKADGALRCAGQRFAVRFAKRDEPVVISSSGNDALAQSIQKKLTRLWFHNAVHQQLGRLDAMPVIDPTLQLHPLFQQHDTDAQALLDNWSTHMEWTRFGQWLQTQFSDSILHMRTRIIRQNLIVVTELSRLTLSENPGRDERRKLKVCRARLDRQYQNLEKLNNNMLRLKSELSNLSHLISFCTEPQMIAIFKQRMINFQQCISDFARGAMDPNEVATLNATLETQAAFLRDFGPGKIAQCYQLLVPADTPITLRRGIVPPVGRVYQQSLIELLVDPAKSLGEVTAMMENLRNKNERLCQIKISQKGLAEKIEANMRLCVFSDRGELYQAGLDSDFGLSFYTPATYARIVTLQKIRQDLLNPAKNFRKKNLVAMRMAILDHFRHVIAEGEQIIEREHGDFSLRSTALHRPKTTPDGVPVRHEYWGRHVKSETFARKVGLIRKNLAIARAANRTAIAQLKRRQKIMDSMAQKIAPLKESAHTYRKQMTKLRQSFE